MKGPRKVQPIDLVLEEGDNLQVDLQSRSDTTKMLYVNLNGVTILRIHTSKINVQLCELSFTDNIK